MKRILFICLFSPLLLVAQTKSDTAIKQDNMGIKFLDSSWQAILQMAKNENKFIFVDCYATWCKPCKTMEQEVFIRKQVGDFMNANFISLRAQMDTTKSDNEFVKSGYGDANELQKSRQTGRVLTKPTIFQFQNHKVNVFPSYLFFSPDGEIVHCYSGALSENDFLTVARNALDPDKQYYSLLDKYKSGKLEPSKYRYLALVTKQIGEKSLAEKMARDYLNKYLNKQPFDKLEKKHFDFVYTYSSILSSKDKVFTIMYRDGDKVDELMHAKGFSKGLVQLVITREEIDPKIRPGGKPISKIPQWDQWTASIQKKYNSYYADQVIMDAQYDWYLEQNDTSNLIKYWVKKLDRFGADTAGWGAFYLNNFAFDYVLPYCSNKDTLNKAAGWIKQIIEGHPKDYQTIDTYANLVYKSGRNDEAILWEEKAVLLDKAAAKKESREPDPFYAEVVEKMKKGIPTW